MKKIIPIVLFLIIICDTPLPGQSVYRRSFQKSTFLVGANFMLGLGSAQGGLNYYTISDRSTIAPKAGYFLFDGLAVGVTGEFTTTTFENLQGNSSKYVEYAIGPILKYYTHDGFFIYSDFTFGTMPNKIYLDYTESKVNVRKWQLGIGHAFFVNNSISLQPGILYRRSEYTSREGKKGSIREFGIQLGIHVFLYNRT